MYVNTLYLLKMDNVEVCSSKGVKLIEESN